MNIFFDLDGTLINSMDRLYQLFQYLVPSSSFSYNQYWQYKKNKIGHPEILRSNFGFSDELIQQFQHKWLNLIEANEWLILDKPFVGVTNFIGPLAKEHSLYIVTARQFEDATLRQIESFGWGRIFKKILVTQAKREKHSLVLEHVKTAPEDWFIGDTGKDVLTGKLLGIKTCAVLSGFLNKERLTEYRPDVIIDSVLNFKTII